MTAYKRFGTVVSVENTATLKSMYSDLSDLALMQRYEIIGAEAARQYALKQDTAFLDSECDDMQSELERRGF